MDDPDINDDAFCPILWQANGGLFNKKGRPIFNGDGIEGNCRNPGDCAYCKYMQASLLSLSDQGIASLWVCPACVSEIRESARENNITYRFPGFYTEGFCQRPLCSRVGDDKLSIVLQLITVFGPTIP